MAALYTHKFNHKFEHSSVDIYPNAQSGGTLTTTSFVHQIRSLCECTYFLVDTAKFQ